MCIGCRSTLSIGADWLGVKNKFLQRLKLLVKASLSVKCWCHTWLSEPLWRDEVSNIHILEAGTLLWSARHEWCNVPRVWDVEQLFSFWGVTARLKMFKKSECKCALQRVMWGSGENMVVCRKGWHENRRDSDGTLTLTRVLHICTTVYLKPRAYQLRKILCDTVEVISFHFEWQQSGTLLICRLSVYPSGGLDAYVRFLQIFTACHAAPAEVATCCKNVIE